jgi:hypothetical protein
MFRDAEDRCNVILGQVVLRNQWIKGEGGVTGRAQPNPPCGAAFDRLNLETDMMHRYGMTVAAALSLAACNQTASAPPPATVQAQPQSASLVTPTGFRLPEGQGCSGDVARFRAVQDNDLETGHVNRTVYNSIKAEIDQAAALCAAGNDGGSRAALSATKRKYGYPA